MSMLLILWIVSGMTLVGVILYARHIAAKVEFSAPHVAPTLPDVVASEVALLHRDFSKLIDVAKPHGKRTLAAGVVMVKRGQDVFIRRVYGRIQSEKGRASSFFLKQIAEHKEKDAKRDDGERSM